jgi:hypothetical protein
MKIRIGKNGGPMSPTGSGALFEKITVPMVMRGTLQVMIWQESKAWRWGEEGIAGICDDQQLLCFGLSLWNKRDSILKGVSLD